MSSIQSAWTEVPGLSDVASRYVNSVEISYSQWDMTFDFQLATPEKVAGAEEAQLQVQRVARIVVSPTHAKVLAENIREAVSGWEARFGPLPDVAQLASPPPTAPEGETEGGDD
jgi:hypothetical protein